MKLISHLYVTVVFVLFLIVAKAQQASLQFERVFGTKGVSLGKITAMTQDKFGYMWFVDQGNRCVVRYDGYRMKIYRNIIGDSNTISSVGLEAIASDTNGNIWIGNADGVDKLIPQHNKVTHYYFPGGRKSGYVLSAFVDHSGELWLGTAEGLYNLEQHTGKFTFYVNNPKDSTSLSCNFVYNIYEDHENVMWIGTGWPYGNYIFNIPGGGLNKFNRQSKTFTRYMHDPHDPHSLANNKVRAMFEDSRGNFWVGTQGDGLHIMDRKNGTFQRLSYDPSNPAKLARPPTKGADWDHIPFVVEDGSGAIWIGTYAQGLVRYDPATEKVDRFLSETRTNGFTDNACWCAYRSRDGALWISTEQQSLFRVDPIAGKFSFDHLEDAGRYFLEDPPGTIWIGKFNDGITKLTRTADGGQQYKSLQLERGANIGINSICKSDAGKYLVGTFRGIYRFDPKSELFGKTSMADTKHGKDRPVISLFNDSANHTLYITGIGFRILNTQNHSLEEYLHDPHDSTSLSGDTLVVSVRDRIGNFWIGTKSSGIDYFDKTKKKFTHFLSDLTVFSAFIDSNETVWAGTMHGLFKKEKGAKDFFHCLAPSEELANAAITAITNDQKGNLWASTSSGIVRINRGTNAFASYGRRYGIKDIDWNTKSHAIMASDGKIFMGAASGVYSFYPDEVINNTKPQIQITGFKIDGHAINPDSGKVLDKPFEQVSKIVLNYDQNIFSIDFAAIHFSDPENNIHQYMLEGYENAWREPGAEKTAYYFNLPAGSYTFRINALSSYGVAATKSVQIIILPPWWRTWWAYLLYGTFAVFAIWAFIRWRTAMLKRENILLEEKVALRTKELVAMQSQLIAEKEAKLIADFNQKFSESELKALRAQMNPHFVFNILNTIESYALDNNKEAASLMIQKFSRLTRMVLENSMNQLVPLKSDLKALQLYVELEQMRYADRFHVSYKIEQEILDEEYLVPPMIIQPFVENAILHGLRNKSNNNGMLNVSANLVDGYIEVAVEDNGIGRTKSAQLKINNPIPKKSYGIKVTQDRISIFNNLNESRKAKVEIQDLKEGTRVIIQLPLPV